VLVTSPSRFIHTAGLVAVRRDGSVPATLEEQANLVWENIMHILAEVGWGPTNVVSITTYVVVGENLGVVMAARDKNMLGHRAASTLIPVPALAKPEWKIEIAIVAAGL